MKPRWDEDEYNTPEEMLVRITFLVCLATFTAGTLVTLAGAITHEPRLVILGVALLSVAGLTHTWLRRHGRWDQADAALHEIAQPGPHTDAAKIAELVRLLQQWEKLESRRGSPGFDPWALQAVRHDIRVMVDGDPVLEGLFRDRRRAA